MEWELSSKCKLVVFSFSVFGADSHGVDGWKSSRRGAGLKFLPNLNEWTGNGWAVRECFVRNHF